MNSKYFPSSYISPIIVRTLPSGKSAGLIRVANLRLRCALGRSGIQALKREGDGATPLGVLPLLRGFCTRKIVGRTHPSLPLRVSKVDDGWCDEAGDANYNRPVRLPYPASAEVMRRDDGLYDIGFVLDWNISSRCHRRGSAIFLHLARQRGGNELAPTQGCLALRAHDMMRLLPYLKRGRKIIIQR